MVDQGDGLLPRSGGGGTLGVIRRQQLHQGRRELLRSPPGSLGLEPVPLAILDGQGTLQALGQVEGLRWPVPRGTPEAESPLGMA
jgi:hypothetical protein